MKNLRLLLSIALIIISSPGFPQYETDPFSINSHMLNDEDSSSFIPANQAKNLESKKQEWLTKQKALLAISLKSTKILEKSISAANKKLSNTLEYNKKYSIEKSREFSKKINEYMRSTLDTYNIPGIAVGVWIKGKKVFFKGKGISDLSTGQGMNLNDKFRIASLSKTFLSTVVLQLVDEGKLSLEDKLSNFVPAVPNSDNITVRQMLNMTSGLYDYTEDDYFSEQWVNNPLRKWTPEELLNIGIKHAPVSSPGEEYYYSNTNYVLLGMIIEQVTGSTIEKEITKRIIKPLKLKNTSVPTTPFMTGKHMHGYLDKDDDGILEDITTLDPSSTWAAGGMVSNVNDLSIWVKALVEGSLISQSSHEQQLNNQGYGLGLTYADGYYGHEGHILGFNSCMLYDPIHEVTIIVVLNRQPNEHEGVAGGVFVQIEQFLKSLNYLEK